MYTLWFQKNKFFYFWGSKTQKLKSLKYQDSKFWQQTYFNGLYLYFALKMNARYFVKLLSSFARKLSDMVSLKRNFLHNFPSNFARIF